MNAKERRRFKKKLYNSFSPQGKSAYYKVKKNVLFVVPYPAATLEHELAKFLTAYLHRSGVDVHALIPKFLKRIPDFIEGIDYKSKGKTRDYITEAVENKTDLRRDFVDLETGEIIEFEHDYSLAKKKKGKDYEHDKVVVYEL